MVKIFFSYATMDSNKYQIPQLAELLEAKPNIDQVFYWEKSSTGSIIEYMDKNVSVSEACVFFYSETAASSGPVQQERDMAVHQGKHIIPIFTNINDVPKILQIHTGIDASGKPTIQVADEIYRLVSLKFEFKSLGVSEDIPTQKAPSVQRQDIDHKSPFRRKMVRFRDVENLKNMQKEIGNNIKSHQFEINDKGFVISLDLSSFILKNIPEAVFSFQNLMEINLSSDLLETDKVIRDLVFNGKVIRIDGKEYVDGQIKRKKEEIIKIIKNLQVAYKQFTFVKINSKTGLSIEYLKILVEEMILKGELDARIQGESINFTTEN